MKHASIDSGHQPVKAVYELRDAAVQYGRAVAHLDAEPSFDARDEVLAKHTMLEEKTVAAIDECSENAEEAAHEALSRPESKRA